MLKPHTAILLSLRHTFDFKGRSRRSEFWWFSFFAILAYLSVALLDAWILPDIPAGVSEDEFGFQGWLNQWSIYPVSTAFGYALFLPSLTVGIRRLHDIGRRSWPMIIYMILNEVIIYIDPVRGDKETQIPIETFVQLFPQAVFYSISPLYLAAMLLTLGFLVYLFLMCIRDSQQAPNAYGPSPKYGDPTLVF